VVHPWQAGTAPTSAKDETADADAVHATPDNVKTFRDEVREHIRPGESRSDFDGTLFLIEDDVPETGHRNLDTRR
jgi:hypothetical protein